MIPRIREIHLQNYKSIAQAVVRLSDFTILVGTNGSGKTNFVDALAFVQECLADSIEAAFLSRRGFSSVCHLVETVYAGKIGIRIILDLGPATVADYAFEISVSAEGRFSIARERCVVERRGVTHRFLVENGEFREEIAGIRPRIEPDRLVLYAASSTEEFRPVYDFLVGMRHYVIAPEQVGDFQNSGPGSLLEKRGGNAASVLKQLQAEHPDRVERISRLLGSVVSGVRRVGAYPIGPMLVLFADEGAEVVTSFPAYSLSEGTLRLLGLFLAAYQASTPSLMVVEDPEAAVHPAAVEVVASVLLDASKRGQVIVTTHSPDILDFKPITDDTIRVVMKIDGKTTIAPISAASRQAIREHLYSAGELLRSDELNADLRAAAEASSDLFGPPAKTLEEAA